MNIPLYYLLEQAAAVSKGGIDPPEDVAAILIGSALATLNRNGDPLTVPELCGLIKSREDKLSKWNTAGCCPCKQPYPLPPQSGNPLAIGT